jgi:uracil phosphoribosyltransferase
MMVIKRPKIIVSILLNFRLMKTQINILDRRPSVFTQFLSEIRDVGIQTDSLRFRRNLERLGEVFAYEISKTLHYREEGVQTPLGVAKVEVLEEQPVLATILRAGLPLHRGLLNYFDRAENMFISAYRKHDQDSDAFEVEIEYLSSPSVEGKTVILCDPMLASGASMVLAYKALLARGLPLHVHVVAIIASEEGLRFTQKNLPDNVTYWMGSVDQEMTDRKYIVPGLGDAGDLAYGAKD